jgi:hypothetical protein
MSLLGPFPVVSCNMYRSAGQDGRGKPGPYKQFIPAGWKVPVRVRRIRRGLRGFGLPARPNRFVYWHLAERGVAKLVLPQAALAAVTCRLHPLLV